MVFEEAFKGAPEYARCTNEYWVDRGRAFVILIKGHYYMTNIYFSQFYEYDPKVDSGRNHDKWVRMPNVNGYTHLDDPDEAGAFEWEKEVVSENE